jgi:phosphate transport system substrate-binding protein
VRRTTPRFAWMAALLLVIGLVAAACGDDKDDASDSSDSTETTAAPSGSFDYSALSGTLNGTGSSFQDAFQQKARTEFGTVASDVTVNYTKSGSSAGKQDLANQVVQFAGTDSLIKDEDLPSFKGGDVLYFPIVAAPITISYNLPGVDLKLSPGTIAGIFSATITTWDADEIKADNPDADLPSTPIAVVHRSDGSGTTSNFTKYLTAAAGSDWTLGSGDTVPWPASTQGAEKNSGVATLISTTEGAVGYVDLSDAVSADLQLAEVENAAGKFVAPTLEAASAALEGTAVEEDLTYDPLNAPGDKAYPITSPTWVIVYKTQPDAAVGDAIKGYLNFLLTDGQGFANSVGYASLPDDMVAKAIAQIDSIS